VDSGVDSGLVERVAQLEAITVELKQEMTALRQKIDDLFAG
jgi:hypothetical protein